MRVRSLVRIAPALALIAAMVPDDCIAGDRQSFGFALHLERYRFEPRIDGETVNTLSERVGIRLWEPAGPGLQLALTLGQAWLTRSDYPTPAGSDLSGFFLDLNANQRLGAFGNVEPFVQGSYGFEQAGAGDDTEGELHLHALEMALGAQVALASRVAISGSVGRVLLRGSEKTTTPVTRHRDIEEGDATSAALQLELNVDRGGYVGLRADARARRGFALYFARFY
jgi:hypothetical protein